MSRMLEGRCVGQPFPNDLGVRASLDISGRSVDRANWWRDPLKPDLAPPGVDAARATLTLYSAVPGLAEDTFQNDYRRLHHFQLSSPFVDKFRHPRTYLKDLAAVGYHLGVEEQIAIGVRGVYGS